MTTAIRSAMQADLRTAIGARDRISVSALRTTLAAISNAEAVSADGSRPGTGVFANEVARKVLDDADVRSIIEGERAELRSSVDEYERVGQAKEAAALRAQVAVLDRYLQAG